jgi:hypothetical protein
MIEFGSITILSMTYKVAAVVEPTDGTMEVEDSFRRAFALETDYLRHKFLLFKIGI